MSRKSWVLLEVIGVLAVVALLAFVLYGRVLPESKQLSTALDKIPRPPNTPEFQIEGDDMDTSFYFTAEYNDRSMEDIQAFYQNYFTENGWTDDFAPEETRALISDGLQSFTKGNENVTVTIIDLNGTLQLMVDYDNFPYSHEEFATLTTETATAEAKALVVRVKDAYLALENYRDTGTHADYDDGELFGKATFETRKTSNGDLYFEMQDASPLFHKTAHVMSRQGDEVRLMSDYDDAPTVDADITMAIGTLYGVTSCISGNIPELLLGLDDGALFRLANLAIQGEETLPDGTVCIRLSGTGFGDDLRSIWIGKEDSLIRQIESRRDRKNWSVTTYTPVPNAPIAPEEMVFKPPVVR